MALGFRCHGCGKTYRVNEDKAGARVRCKECSAIMRVPHPDKRPTASRPSRVRKQKQRGRRRNRARASKPSPTGKWILIGGSAVAVIGMVAMVALVFLNRDAANNETVAAEGSSAGVSELQPISNEPPTADTAAADSRGSQAAVDPDALSEDSQKRPPADAKGAGSEVPSLPIVASEQTAASDVPSHGYLARIAAGGRTYIPAGCKAVSVIHMQRLWNWKLLEEMFAPSLESQMQQTAADYGFELRDISEVVAFANRNTVGNTLYPIGIKSPGSSSLESSEKPNKREILADKLYEIVVAFEFIYDYGDPKQRFPRANGSGDGRQTGLSWRVHLLPYIAETELYLKFRLDEPWDSIHNKKLIRQMPETYKVDGVDEPGMTSMHVFTGPGTPFGGRVGASYNDFTDGDQTLLVVAAGADTADIWTHPGGLPFDPANPAEALGTIAGSEIQLAALEGARSIRSDIDPQTLARLIQHQDGEKVIPPPWFVDPAYAASREYSPAWMLGFSEPYNREQILQADWSGAVGAVEETVDGRSLFVARGTGIHFIDDRTLLLGSESQLRMMLRTTTPEESLSKQLVNMRRDSDIFVAVDTAGLKDLATVAANQLPALENLPDTKTLAFSLNLSGQPGDLLLEILAMLNSPDAARRAEIAIQQRFGETRDLPSLIQAVLGEAPEPVSEFASQFDALIDLQSVASEVSVASNDTLLELAVSVPDGLDQVLSVVSSHVAKIGADVTANHYFNAAKMIGLAIMRYDFDHHGLPRADGDFEGPHTGLSWRVHILPYLDERTLYEQFHFDEPWDSPHNSALIELMPSVFRTPGVDQSGRTALHVFIGDGTPLGGDTGVNIQQVLDGTTNTIMFISAGAEVADVWTKPGGLVFDSQDPGRVLGQPTDRGWLAVTMDGFPSYIPNNISTEVLSRLIQHADLNPVEVPGR